MNINFFKTKSRIPVKITISPLPMGLILKGWEILNPVTHRSVDGIVPPRVLRDEWDENDL